MLRFADSTLAWDDDSDSRSSPKATIRTDDISNEGEIDSQDSENESESESEEEDDDEEKDECEGPVQNTDKTIKEKVKTPVKILSKKEKKKIEMEELESVLADLGIPGISLTQLLILTDALDVDISGRQPHKWGKWK